jgi:NitT/TauT family transport system ATP-binding protein
VFQGDDSLFPWLTALDNVMFGLKMRGVPQRKAKATAREYVNLVGLSDHVHKYPRELSGGMKQRVQIARVLANDASILLMDEPFAALDAQTRADLQDELANIWVKTGKTILFVTHDITEALLLADRTAVMRVGPGSSVTHLLEVDLPRPRSRGMSALGEAYERLRGLIRSDTQPEATT